LTSETEQPSHIATRVCRVQELIASHAVVVVKNAAASRTSGRSSTVASGKRRVVSVHLQLAGSRSLSRDHASAQKSYEDSIGLSKDPDPDAPAYREAKPNGPTLVAYW
jgi:hypothetical protein